MALKYSTIAEFVKYIGFYKRVPSAGSNTQDLEEVGTGNTVTAGFYLKNFGVISSTLVLTTTDDTTLVVTTDYTFDSLTSKITLTTAGKTALAKLGLRAAYGYIQEGVNLSETDVEDMLERIESEVDESVGTVFADQTTALPSYTELSNELHMGHGHVDDYYRTYYFPLIELSTTTNGAFTTGSTALTLADASGFPNSGVINVGGNKVTYTAKSSDTLTVSTSTPTIGDGSVARGEIIEVSVSPAGVTPVWTVLTANTDYSLDFDTGALQVLDDYYVRDIGGLTRPPNGVMNRLRASYFSAWHPVGRVASIPKEINKLVYKMAAFELSDSAILKANASNLENFSPTVLSRIRGEIEKTLNKYKSILVGRS